MLLETREQMSQPAIISITKPILNSFQMHEVAPNYNWNNDSLTGCIRSYQQKFSSLTCTFFLFLLIYSVIDDSSVHLGFVLKHFKTKQLTTGVHGYATRVSVMAFVILMQ